MEFIFPKLISRAMCAHFQAVQAIPARRQKRALLGKRLQTLKVLLGHSAESEWSRQSLPFAHRADANNTGFWGGPGHSEAVERTYCLKTKTRKGGKSASQALRWPTMANNWQRGATMAYNGKLWQTSVRHRQSRLLSEPLVTKVPKYWRRGLQSDLSQLSKMALKSKSLLFLYAG